MNQEMGFCPKCNSPNLLYGGSGIDNDEYYYEYVCDSCQFEGIEWYSLKFELHTDKEDNLVTSHERIE